MGGCLDTELLSRYDISSFAAAEYRRELPRLSVGQQDYLCRLPPLFPARSSSLSRGQHGGMTCCWRGSRKENEIVIQLQWKSSNCNTLFQQHPLPTLFMSFFVTAFRERCPLYLYYPSHCSLGTADKTGLFLLSFPYWRGGVWWYHSAAAGPSGACLLVLFPAGIAKTSSHQSWPQTLPVAQFPM